MNYNEREQQVVAMRYKGDSYARIGSRFGITRERVRQVIRSYIWRHDEQSRSELFFALRQSESKRPSYVKLIEEAGVQARADAIRTIVPYNIFQCFSCRNPVSRIPKNGIISFCANCWTKYFVRVSGSELEGIDRTREIVRIRDKHTCQGCRKVWVMGSRRFDIHHLNGDCGKKSHSYDKVEDMDGLITLCHKCHTNLESVRHKIGTKTGNVKAYNPRGYAIMRAWQRRQVKS